MAPASRSRGSSLLDTDAAERVSPTRSVGRGAALDLHEGISDPAAEKCGRWPEHFALLNETTGERRPGRCKATNLCRYCQKLYVVETVEMLSLDALEYAPTLWAVLTAREHLSRRDTYAHLQQLRRAAKKRWPAVEWFVQVEFQRRGALHLNLLVKGVPIDQEGELLDVLSRVWCSRVDALPQGQWVGVVAEAEGVVRYLSKMLAHGLKAEQAPPIGWRGHRTSQSRGYLVRPAAIMREEARRSLTYKRELWKLLRDHPEVDAVTADDVVTARLEAAIADTWRLVQTLPLTAARPISVVGTRLPPVMGSGARSVPVPPPARARGRAERVPSAIPPGA